MPVPWFTVEEEKPDIGTVMFKADDYYEKLNQTTGMWNDDKFLHYEMIQKSPEQSSGDEQEPKPVDPSIIFNVRDIASVPQLLAYLDRANMRGALPAELLDFMWDLHKLYIKKMTEYGFATKWMSKKEFSLLENREKWTKLIAAMEELRKANEKEGDKVLKRKRMLKPTQIKVYKRLEDMDTMKISKDGSLVPLKPGERKLLRQKAKQHKSQFQKKKKGKGEKGKALKKSQSKGDTFRTLDGSGNHHFRRLFKTKNQKGDPFFAGKTPPGPYSWDYGKTRLFDRAHVRIVKTHFEFTRLYHKISKAIRFSTSEPVDWRTITLEEVDKHRFQSDCWMVIKGRVYDVTDYLDLHPGGAKVMMQGAGTDATGIFNSVHPYVVFYKYLVGKQIGTVPNYEEHRHTEWEPPQYFNVFRLMKDWWNRRKHPLDQYRAKTVFQQNDLEYIFTVTFPSTLKSRVEDWTITIVGGFKVTVIKLVEAPYVWYGGFDLATKVLDDTVYRTFSPDLNQVEIKIAKSYKVRVKEPVRDWRQDNGFFLSSYSLKDMYRASVVDRKPVTDGVKLYGISLGMNKFMGCPIGSYVNLRILDETRPYTPVCLPDEFMEKFQDESGEFQTLCFIIKEFRDGDFTSMLHHMPTKHILVGVDIYVSPPMGNFKVDFLFDNMDVMLLIAGGTGISVMTRIIQEYIQRTTEMHGKIVCLIHFAQYREDLIWKEVWSDLKKKYHWFHYYFSLTRIYRYAHAKEKEGGNKQKSKSVTEEGIKKQSKKKVRQPIVLESDPANIHELYGYPATSKLEHIFHHLHGANKPEKQHKAIVCGPFGFNHSCRRMLEQFGKHTDENIHIFAG